MGDLVWHSNEYMEDFGKYLFRCDKYLFRVIWRAIGM